MVLLFSCAMLVPRGAFAEAGVDDAGADDSSTEEDASDEAGASEVPLACDGGLCDTTVGSTTCAMPRGTIHGAPSAAAICVVLSVVLARRLQRRATEQGR
ncbi:MAG: hypothetical protein FWD69_16355 [Polyangiaceae bacterium]|nr:hypothetical protein [Polyangiaceae bacterium]